MQTLASVETPPPCPKNVRTRQTLFPPDCGRLLWTAPYRNTVKGYLPCYSIEILYILALC